MKKIKENDKLKSVKVHFQSKFIKDELEGSSNVGVEDDDADIGDDDGRERIIGFKMKYIRLVIEYLVVNSETL